ncbi:hypothetical protein [Domibacillus epiphyticus]|uniref:Uncharacterized protein n=1 Tax=Domibacillus epiphyticus TaxID=1714355 RepID=A0A1V2A8B2_9BACI|nr:hypothetical protein [Domibacillus epiphyticus]OMP67239.1 hypothetical protein BTO28_07865 [Domibacillus epiphyticus]
MKINSSGNVSTAMYLTAPKNNNQFEEVLKNTRVREGGIKQFPDHLYHSLATKYDVRNATFEEITDVANSLYKAGEISLREVAVLTFDYERAAQSIRKNANGSVSSNFSMYETAANENGKRDWIAEFELRAAKDFKYGNLVGHSNKMKILSVLQRLDAQ